MLDELVSDLARSTGFASAALVLLAGDRVWVKASTVEAGFEVATEDTFCAHVVQTQRTTIVPDVASASAFERPYRMAGGTIGFYAGVPITTSDGTALGSLCVWDSSPRSIPVGSVRLLEQSGRYATALLEARRSRVQLDRLELLLSATSSTLEKIVDGVGLSSILDQIAQAVEASTPDTKCSILLVDGSHLHHGSGPSLPADYREAIDGVRIGPNVGSCGTAAYLSQTVVVSDIATDPRWVEHRHHARAAGLKACWSVPILGNDSRVIGTFALYYDHVRSPDTDDLAAMDRWVNVAQLAITRAEELAALRDAAQVDHLTGLMNRAVIIRVLAAAIRRPHSHTAVLFLDLDQFKLVNDTLGHSAGDRCLNILAERMVVCVAGEAQVGRWGGDEFVLICSSEKTIQAEPLAARVIAAVREPLTIYGRTFALAATVGIAVHEPGAPDAAGDAERLVADADLAMYTAKRSRRNSIAVFSGDVRSRTTAHLALEGDLSQALANNEITPAYQPVVDIRSGEVVAVEALMRWTTPTRGSVSPSSFIGVAEDSGQILALGEFMCASSCQAEWSGLRCGVAVQDPFGNCRSRSMCPLANYRIPNSSGRSKSSSRPPRYRRAAWFLEVTESVIVDGSVQANMTLVQLRAMGIRIAIDDFGTGFSSLAQLRNLPADVLKIDRQFIQGVATSSADAGIIQAIVTLAETMNLGLVAEGIEDPGATQETDRVGCGARPGLPVLRAGPGRRSIRGTSSFGPCCCTDPALTFDSTRAA